METEKLLIPDLLALMPCGLRNPFKDHVESFMDAHSEWFSGLNYLVEGNVNHETRYYPEIDRLKSVDELPDVVVAADVNSFFHRRFMDQFSSHFTTFLPYPPHPYLGDAGFCDPDQHFSAFTANLLVMAVDKTKLGNRPIPTCWADLLRPDFADDIILRGEDDFFCNAVLLPYYKEYGMDAIRLLARNIKSGRHPAEMVKMAGSDREGAAAVYVLPYFFAAKIRSAQVEVVWPSDGAILSPVFLLVKKNTIEKHRKMLDFIFSKETAEVLVRNLAPSLHPEVSNELFPGPAKWLDWDFLKNNDIGTLKDEIQKTFMPIWKSKSSAGSDRWFKPYKSERK
jgi:ABC-type Fe3+ transport system substrate-binding protein